VCTLKFIRIIKETAAAAAVAEDDQRHPVLPRQRITTIQQLEAGGGGQ
jgi:hypothetical protein